MRSFFPNLFVQITLDITLLMIELQFLRGLSLMNAKWKVAVLFQTKISNFQVYFKITGF